MDTEFPGIDDPEIIRLCRQEELPRGQRSDSVLLIMNAAGKSGMPNHEILAIGSSLAVKWGITDPGRNLYRHWSGLLAMLRNVRKHYPAPR